MLEAIKVDSELKSVFEAMLENEFELAAALAEGVLAESTLLEGEPEEEPRITGLKGVFEAGVEAAPELLGPETVDWMVTLTDIEFESDIEAMREPALNVSEPVDAFDWLEELNTPKLENVLVAWRVWNPVETIGGLEKLADTGLESAALEPELEICDPVE